MAVRKKVKPQPGICCPECETNLHEVEDTRRGKGLVVRRRKCYNGHRFSTTELIVSTSDKEMIRQMTKLLQKFA